MILSFSTQLNGKPTYFPEKIWQGFPDSDRCIELWFTDGKIYTGYDFHPDAFGMFPKLHTIRKDEKNRWKAGNKIDFFINARTKNMFRFAPIIPVVSTQKITIEHDQDYKCVLIDNIVFYEQNSKLQTHIEAMTILAQNDGFESVDAFFEYFNEDFTGKIIHWTDLKY